MSTVLVKRMQEKRRYVANVLWDLLPYNEDVDGFNNQILADALGPDYSVNTIKDYTKKFNEQGWLSREFEYGYTEQGRATGRRFTWRLLIPKAEMLIRLADLEANEMRPKPKAKPKTKLAVPVGNGRDVVAAVGPEPTGSFEALRAVRKDESFALVAAARQYSERTHTLDTSVSALVKQAAELGVSIDVAALRASMTVAHDERLETISLVLPYVTQLENAVTRLSSQVEVVKAKLAECERLANENRNLRAQNQRLIAEKVATH